MLKHVLAIGMVLALVFMAFAVVPMNVGAIYTGDVTIKSDGSVDPLGAPISKVGTIYTLTDDISGSITIEKSGITLDGAGYTLEGSGGGEGIYMDSQSKITINNFNIKGFFDGMYIQYSSGLTITDNTILDCSRGIQMFSCTKNTLSGNTLTGCGLNTLGFEKKYWNTHTIDTTNTANGKPVYYWKNANGGTIPSGAGQVILANCKNVVVKNQDTSDVSVGIAIGFSSKNTISKNIASNCIRSMYFQQSHANTVIENTASGSSFGGINIDNSNRNLLCKNKCLNNGVIGIYTSSYSNKNTIKMNTVSGSSYGIRTEFASDTSIIGNTVSGSTYGINPYSSNGNTIKGNAISNSRRGIYLYESNDNTIKDNTISGSVWQAIRLFLSNSNTLKENTILNSNYGVYLRLSNKNTLFHNNMMFNTNQAYDDGTNAWNTGKEGNYWSDYSGIDADNNGIGDTPYVIDADTKDKYPLMNPY
jgi:parallel beta-helix repeat protein